MRLLILTLVLLGLPVESAHAQKFGDWYIPGPTSEGFYALTSNDSLQIFGQFCYASTGTCIWVLSLDKICVKGDRYPVLINADDGAMTTDLLCDIPLDGGRYRYFFTGFDDIDRVIRGTSARIGVAVPIKGGTFTVIRFSLKGAVDALASIHRDTLKRKGSPPNNTRDQKL